jgi:hypothetical protein
MDVLDLLTRLGWFFIGAAAITCLLAYLARVALRHVLALELEAFKQQLQMEGVMAMERLRAELRRTAAESDGRPSNLQDKQAEIIGELYKRMVFLRNAITKITGPGPADQPGPEDKTGGIISAGEQLGDYFDQHRIYLDESLCRKLQCLQATFFDAWVKHSFAVAKDQYARQGKGMAVETWKNLSEEVQPILQEIEDDFRAMLRPRTSAR